MKKKGKNKETGIENLRIKSSQLFDIAACKCCDFEACCCDRDKRIPPERKLIADQRRERKMMIGAIDRKTTSAMKKKKYREDKERSIINLNIK